MKAPRRTNLDKILAELMRSYAFREERERGLVLDGVGVKIPIVVANTQGTVGL